MSDKHLQERAEVVGQVMSERDQLARHLGVSLEEIRPGYARCSMTVRADMSNAAAIGHGGATFTLADIAFAYACNSHDRTALATSCSITFIGPVEIGDTLSAVAKEVSLRGRNGICDVTVSNNKGENIAMFRGHSRQINAQLTD
ncbi:MAG: hydroxyphenylacetyl-CoA thioesterase PaaI [Rhodospirillaceae bacterium]|nr:hydroxyphenylacetyl-CoA thioesterase PaaI [Rhodospirillaceae bacterium]MBL6931258.1 hydroxyphenylacetyl-CoA thioesterase PaaI [Rhodospirillales bacterium]